MEGAMYRKNPLWDNTCMKSGKYSSNMRFSNWLLSCVFSNVGDIVLVEIGSKLTKVGSERRAWRSFEMMALHLCGGGAGRDGTAGAPAP